MVCRKGFSNGIFGTDRATYTIAEIGSNHGGSLETAIAYIEACATAGADAVKFQSWHTSTILNSIDPASGKPAGAVPILERYELPHAWHAPLKAHCDRHGVDFLSTPFDTEKARLIRQVGAPAMKIASGDLTFVQLLREVGTYDLPVLLSTGMSEIEEIATALEALGPAKHRTILLHCVGAYPPSIEDANLRAIPALAETFGLPVGFSDHYPGYTTAVAAVALGACVIEKHVTFSRQAGHPDSPFALEIDEYAEMVEQIRLVERALGDRVKTTRPSEAGGRIGGRRSLYWRADLAPGTVIRHDHLAPLRPAMGELAPADMDRVIGRKVARAVTVGASVAWSDLEKA